MNIFKKTILLCLSIFLLSSASVAGAQVASAEQINSYQTAITINSDGSINVSEKIDYDFGTAVRHGIFRTIPYSYKARGGNFNLRISDISVTDEKAAAQPFTTSRSLGKLEIKIGDPNQTITGEKTYIINYRVRRAINYFADHDELYWNVIGTDWIVPILQARATVTFPFDTTKEHSNTECFIGTLGATKEECTISVPSGNTVSFAVGRPLNPHEGLTIVAGFPKGLIAEPSLKQKLIYIIQDNGILVLPVLVFLIMFRLWWKKGRDAKGHGVIVPQYEAPNSYTPVELAVAMRGYAKESDIAAEIIYLATQGYLKIRKTEDDSYELEKLKDAPDNEFDAELMKLLFAKSNTVRLSAFKKDTEFFEGILKAQEKVRNKISREKYYSFSRYAWVPFVFLGFMVFLFGGFVLSLYGGNYGFLAAALSGFVIIIFGIFMPARSEKGAELVEYIEGFKQFLRVAEIDRIKFHNAPEKNPQTFERLLPFAMVLGMEKEWAKQFKDMSIKPDWYEDSGTSSFNSLLFVSSMHNFSGSVNTAVASSAPSSSASGGSGFSGGFSGGGGGGGGGGSW